MNYRFSFSSLASALLASANVAFFFPQAVQSQSLTSSLNHFFYVNHQNPNGIFYATTGITGNYLTSAPTNGSYDIPTTTIGPIGINNNPGNANSISNASACTQASAAASATFNSDNVVFGVTLSYNASANSQSNVNIACQGSWAVSQASSNFGLSLRKKDGLLQWTPAFNIQHSSCIAGLPTESIYNVAGRSPIRLNFYNTAGQPLLSANESTLASINATLTINLFCDLGVGTIDWGSSFRGRLTNGGLAMNLDNPYLREPGILQIQARDGLVTEKVVTGRFAPIADLLPAIGQPASFDIPFSADFPSQLSLEYDFSPIVTDPEATGLLALESNTTLSAPGPLPALGVGVALGFTRRLRRRIEGSVRTEGPQRHPLG